MKRNIRTKQAISLIPGILALAVLSGCQGDKAPGIDAEQATKAQNDVAADDAAVKDPTAEAERLTEWLDAKYEEKLQFSPMKLSRLGRKALYDQIDDMSEEAAAGQLQWFGKTVAELKASFDYDRLPPLAQESYDLWVFEYERDKANDAFRRHRYFANELGGPESSLPSFLISIHKVESVEDMQAYIARIAGIGRAITQLHERAKLSAADGVRPPQFIYDLAQQRAQKVITGAPFNGEGEAPLFRDAKGKIKALQEAGKIDEEAAAELEAAASTALTGTFEPAYDAYIAWLKSDKGNADVEPRGVSALPDGEAYYKNRLANHTTLDISADAVHQMGLDEVARIHKEMETIKQAAGFEGTLQDFFTYIRDDKSLYFPNTDAGREGYLSDTRGFLAEIEEKLPEYFGILPKAKLEVQRVEKFREVDGGAAHYRAGTPDGSRPGTYYIHMSDMGAYSKTKMETTAYHEGSPGHHMQISIAQELEGIPQFRTQAGFGAYIEGWALYSEQLAKEMGQFENILMDFGRLNSEVWRAARLVVDSGLHAKGWSQKQTEDYLLQNTAIPASAIRSEVRRYLTIPGQATSYKSGMLKILELREKAKGELGEKFDIRGFHDTVLGGGSLPLPMLEKRVEHWIREQKDAA
ncbi:DUF885 domain-containing protein [Biformimicrobium ophioploci]|uniref:DUF885 domain-containing protein n=1 Tax=Biformimicrobium ophioploci TaxID=3036711 RepID=A0ABQ6LYG9_9GAMM|nr:DUF885 domain-containing protein [Microbulbifer sp. NKW57]GMG87072.1 DUF885 domain-containing protein [Microbulbifer sp. NKW57]